MSSGPVLALEIILLFSIQFLISGGLFAFGIISRMHEDKIFPKEVRGSWCPRLMHRGRLHLVLTLKSGSARGRCQIKITPELPSGIRLDPVILTAHMEGAERGTNIIANMPFTFNLEGLYWFIIHLNDEVLTKMPFRVKYSRSIVGRPPQIQP